MGKKFDRDNEKSYPHNEDNRCIAKEMMQSIWD